MRRSILITIAVVLIVGGWYWASPYFALAGLRNAVIRGDAPELEKRVDFPRFRESIRTQMSAFMMANVQEQLSDNPFAVLGLAIGAKLADVMVESMVTPAGLVSLMNIKADEAPETSGFALMTSSDLGIRRDGLDSFEYPDRGNDQIPTFRFARDGIQWRLVGLQMPKEFLQAKTRNAGPPRQAAAPFVPKWELSERKDPMDDRVSVVLWRDSDEEVGSGFLKVRPTIVFRCQDKKLEAYINVKRMVDYEHDTYSSAVRLRFDEAIAKPDSWTASKDREALFAPHPKAFLRALRASSMLHFEWQRYGEGAKVAKFSTGDLDAYAGKLAVACGFEN